MSKLGVEQDKGGSTVFQPPTVSKLPELKKKQPKPQVVPVAEPKPVVSEEARVEAILQAWTREQDQRMIDDMRRTRILVMNEVVRAMVDEPRVFLPNRLNRNAIRLALMNLSKTCRTAVDAMTHVEVGEEIGKEAGSAHLGPSIYGTGLLAPNKEHLEQALMEVKDALTSLVFDALQWPEPRVMSSPLWMLRNVVMGQANEGWIQWAYDKERAERLAYLMNHVEAYDWRGPMKKEDAPGSTSLAYREYREHEKSTWEAFAKQRMVRGVTLSGAPLQSRLDSIGPGHRRLGRIPSLIEPANRALGPPEWDGHFQIRLKEHMWSNLHLLPDLDGVAAAAWGKRTTLAQLLLPLDGIRPSLMLGCALGYTPWIVVAATDAADREGKEMALAKHVDETRRLEGMNAEDSALLVQMSQAMHLGAREFLGQVPSRRDVHGQGGEALAQASVERIVRELVSPPAGPMGSSRRPRGITSFLAQHLLEPLCNTWILALDESKSLGTYLDGWRKASGVEETNDKEMLQAVLEWSWVSAGPLHVVDAMEKLMEEEEKKKEEEAAEGGWWARTKQWLRGKKDEALDVAYDQEARLEILTTILYVTLLKHILAHVSENMVDDRIRNHSSTPTPERVLGERRLNQGQYHLRLRQRIDSHLPEWTTDLLISLRGILRYGGQGPFDLSGDDVPQYCVPCVTRDVVTFTLTAAMARTALISYLLRNQWATWRFQEMKKNEDKHSWWAQVAGKALFPTGQENEENEEEENLYSIGEMQLFRHPSMLRSSLGLLRHLYVGAGLYSSLLPVFDVPHTWRSSTSWGFQMAMQGGITTEQLETLNTQTLWPDWAIRPSDMEPAGSLLWMIHVVLHEPEPARLMEEAHPWLSEWVQRTRQVVRAYKLHEEWDYAREHETNQHVMDLHRINPKERTLRVDHGRKLNKGDSVSPGDIVYPSCILYDLLMLLPDYVGDNLWELYLVARYAGAGV